MTHRRKQAGQIGRNEPEPMGNSSHTTEELQRLVHELESHRTELEMQNAELREAQLRLAASQSRYADLYDFAPASYVTLDSSLRITEINLTAAGLLDVPRSYLIGHPFLGLIGSGEKNEFSQRIGECLREGVAVSFETMVRCSGGSLVPVQVDAAPQADPLTGQIAHCRMALTDITIQRRAMQAAEAANRSKTEFLANVSHELRTPMNAILGMTELALAEPLSPAARDYLETSQESAKVLLSLLDELLDLARMEAGKFSVEQAPFSPIGLIEETCRALAVRASAKGLKLACDYDGNAPYWVVGDARRIRQVLTNLIGNGVKFTNRGEVRARMSVVERDDNTCQLRFEVSDTGIGIAPEDHHRIFEAFAQADSSAAKRESGTGLGLSIAANLVRSMGGELAVDSAPGIGSRFFFTLRLPLHAGDAAPSKSSTSSTCLQGVPVLVADSTDAGRRRIERLLRDWGALPQAVESGRELLETARQAAKQGTPFRLMILDAAMMLDSDTPLAEAVQSDPQLAETAVVMLAASGETIPAENLRRRGIVVQLEKPVPRENLLRAIREALGERDHAVPVEPPEPESKEVRPFQPRRILLAEDTPANRKLVVHILQKRGHTIDTAENGREAVEKVQQCQYDLVLMDVQMPEIDGFAATAQIRALPDVDKARVPIVAMTAYAMEQDQQRCLDAGMDAYLAKPIDRAALLEMVEMMARNGACLR